MRKMILFLLWMFSVGGMAQIVTDSMAVVDTHDGMGIWGGNR